MKWTIKNRHLVLLLLCIVLFVFLALVMIFSYNPERMIKGKWKETNWSYENVDKTSFLYHDIRMTHKHESESWRFMPDKQLYFYNGEDVTGKATWKIKGRGHVLQLIYEDGDVELYDIKELNDHELILNFDIGMESRGIARLVFTKIANN